MKENGKMIIVKEQVLNNEELGIYYYGKKEKYEGSWKNDKRNGKGIYYQGKNKKYEGEWIDDEMSGFGNRIIINRDLLLWKRK